jgi:hypothetical protein
MQKTFEVTGPVELDVRIESGTIDVDPTLDGRVEIELIGSDEESQRLIEQARIELHERGDRAGVLVEVPRKRGFSFSLGFNRGIECRIRCPHDSGLDVRSKSADVIARGTLGGLNVATASGDVEADCISGGLSVKSASADVSAHVVGGGVSVQSASGDVDIDLAQGPVSVASASGDLTIGDAHDAVQVNTVSGDVDLGAVVRGNVSAQSVSGDISISVRRGTRVHLDCTTVSGDTTSELELSSDAPTSEGPLVELRARSVSGDISIHRAPAPADSQEVHA